MTKGPFCIPVRRLLTLPTPYMWIQTWGQMSNWRGSFEIQIPCGFDWWDTHFPEGCCGCDCHPVLQVRLWNMARIWDSHKSHVGRDHQWLVGRCNLCRRCHELEYLHFITTILTSILDLSNISLWIIFSYPFHTAYYGLMIFQPITHTVT